MTLRAKTILGIAVIEIILLLLLVFSAMSFLADSNEKQLIQRAHATTSMFAHASTNALISLDLATLEDLSSEIMELEDVVYVRIKREKKLLIEKGQQVLESHLTSIDNSLKTVNDGIFDTRMYIEENGVVYGSVDMGFSTSSITLLLDQARKQIVSIASLEVILVAIFSFVLGNYLTKNLSRLANAALTVSKKGPGYQLRLKQNDELGAVAEAFDQMSLSLKDSYEELRKARVEAEQANEAKGRFLAAMSHEVRTPMNGVLGLLSLLEETNLNKEQKQLLSTATGSGQLLLSIINDILDFSRMEANTLSLEQIPFNVANCVTSAVSFFTTQANEKKLNLNCRIDDSLPEWVQGDPNRFRQILLNLLSNAFKFTEQGEISVHVEALQSDPADNICIHCEVSDTGVGIEPAAQEYLFDEFTMVDQTYSREKEGSGLGLAICKRLVYMMDGDISVKSQPGKGSTFSFRVYLPVCQSPATESNTKPAEVLPQALQNIRILVAEDNRANQLVISKLFENVGLSIDLANNGIEALKMVVRHDYDIVFMDISMPEMDGIQACQAIRKLEDRQKAVTPIIALTAHALSGDRERFMKAGMNDYLSKPVRKSQLTESLSRVLLSTGDQEAQLPPSPPGPHESKDSQPVSAEHLDSQTEQIAGSEATPELVDAGILSQMIADTSEEALPMLIEHYIREAQVRVKNITTAATEQNPEQLEFEAHTLGSSALALGNHILSQQARTIEHLCLEGSYDDAFKQASGLTELAQASFAALILHNNQTLGLAPLSEQLESY